ncbi:MAG: alkaline phosphatase D family protein [Burkholderiales bacterium]|jgi:alkaline phosphatase D|nr:alkaline phosphatase D family protein [Burkholderiales bacterium]MBP7520950.1 alkaline phosphatase D family protein [Leptothrix sp. (in: b-proteobacteria)]HQY07697.1 alkaline phosphatase D family protein [Burkholderiaceae bacterium]
MKPPARNLPILRGSNLLLGAEPAHQPARRRFVRDLALGGLAIGSLGLSACGGDDDEDEGEPVASVTYAHGVASGDPLSDRVILWTRLSTVATTAVTLRWEVSTDAAFTTLAASGSTSTDASRDWTVKVDATGLQPGTRYWYRFAVGTQRSPVGRTRTLPGAAVAQVKLAVFSCSNYPAGYFNVYAEAAQRDDLDATVHLGDYIYEYPRGGYASDQAAALGREVLPANELLTLADYRSRYAQYRSDADLQALHAAAPMIAVWDDHEIANDTWKDGAENHTEGGGTGGEGSFTTRRAAAVQAWHEWLPVRSGADLLSIYRSFSFGNLLALHMLDTRVLARDLQLDYADYTTATGLDAAGFTAALSDTSRQLLGSTQTGWLTAQMSASTATWQVLGQQVLMGRMNIPAPILFEALNPGSGVSVSTYSALYAKYLTDPTSLTATEQAILAQPAIPYNLDAWDGYPVARETVLGTARALDKNLVVLAGDTHNAWASDLQDLSGNAIGVEFATSSVSSPGFETILTSEDPATLAAGLTQLIGPLQYCDTARRGYLLLTATASECRGDWIYVNTVTSRSYTAVSDQSLRVLPGAGNRRIVAV